MRTLWTFGCSFTADYYPVDNPLIKTKYDDYKKWKGGTLPKIWPTLLSEKLNYELKNKGWGGDSNYGIVFKFLEVCEQIKKDDIVIFGWTHVARFQAANFLINSFQQILPSIYEYPETNLSQNTIKEILLNRTHNLWITELHHWIKFINLYLTNIESHVYHWTSDDNIFNKKTEIVNDEQFIVVQDPNFSFNDNIMSYISHVNRIDFKEMSKIIHETNGQVDDQHFGEYGHIHQSEYFYNHIMKYIK